MSNAGGSSKIQILSLAFARLGKFVSVADQLEDPKSAVSSASLTYDQEILTQLSGYPWIFGNTVIELAQLTTPPIDTSWQFAYQSPEGLLRLNAVYIRNSRNTASNFRLYRDQIWSDINGNLLCNFQQNVGPEFFPAYFVNFMVKQMASAIAMNVTQNVTIAQYWAVEAKAQLAKAKFTDSQSEPQPPMQINDILASKYGL